MVLAVLLKKKAALLKREDQRGFTLIELLAVIVILAILAAIAIPAVVTIVNNQNQKSYAQNELNAIHAAKLYVADQNPFQGTSASSIVLTTASSASGSLANYVDKAGGVSGDYTVTVTSSGSYTVAPNSGASAPTSQSSSVGESELIKFSQTGSW
ncbi:MAG: prepilin-type N-terminal cleavage/methylation domain-containing protein [Sporolactobacillus sp.]